LREGAGRAKGREGEMGEGGGEKEGGREVTGYKEGGMRRDG